jgi:hypothetical protein
LQLEGEESAAAPAKSIPSQEKGTPLPPKRADASAAVATASGPVDFSCDVLVLGSGLGAIRLRFGPPTSG